MNTRHLMLTAALSVVMAMPANAESYGDTGMQDTGMVDQFMSSIQAGLDEVQSWFTPAEGDSIVAGMDGDLDGGIEIPPQLIEPAAGDAAEGTNMMDAATDAMGNAADAMADTAAGAYEAAADMAADAVNVVEEAADDAGAAATDMMDGDNAAVEAVEEEAEAVADEATEATEAGMESMTDEAADMVEEVEEEVEVMEPQSMAPQAPTMERIEAGSLRSTASAMEKTAANAGADAMQEVEAIADMAETEMPTPAEGPSTMTADAATQMPEMPTPSEGPSTMTAEAPEAAAETMMDTAAQTAEEAIESTVNEAEAMVEEATEEMQDTLSQTGTAFQNEGSVSAFDDPMMSPEALNAIQAAAGEETPAGVVHGTAEGMIERTGNTTIEQVDQLTAQ